MEFLKKGVMETDMDIDRKPDSQDPIDNRTDQQKAIDEYILSKPNEYNIPERLQHKSVYLITESEKETQMRKDFKVRAEDLENNKYKIYEKFLPKKAERVVKKEE